MKKSNNQACGKRADANRSKKTIAAAAAIQKLKCLQIGDQGNRKSQKPPPYISRVREK